MSLADSFCLSLIMLNLERQLKKAAGKPPTTAVTSTTQSLSNLPEKILLHILSFLPTKTAIQTSLISRQWLNLWSKLPSLRFLLSSSSNFINNTLLNRPLSSPPLDKFCLRLRFDPVYTEPWIRYAVQHNAQELELDFYYYSDGCFSFFLLRNGCVKVLRLRNCTLRLFSSSNFTSTGLGSLRFVFLESINLLQDSIVCDLISGCVNLESLSIDDCKGMKHLKISSLKLKELKLKVFSCNNGFLEINCPNLGSLEMIDFKMGRYDFKDLSGLIEAKVLFLQKSEHSKYWSKVVKSLAHVKRLTVQNWGLKLLASKDVFSGSSLHNLKHLELQTDCSKFDLVGMASLLDLSPNLETMVLRQLKEDNDEIESFYGFGKRKGRDILTEPIHLNLPCLKQVQIKDFRVTKDVELLISVLVLDGEVLEKIILVSPTMVGESSVPPIVLHRELKQVKYSNDQVQNIKFRVVGDEIIIRTEEHISH